MIVLAPGSARPPGNIPRYSAYGLGSFGILTGIIPFFILQSLVPVFRDATDIWLANLLPVIGASGVAGAIVAFGLRRRQAWYIRFFFGFGSFLMLAYMAGFGLGLAILLDLIPEQVPKLRFVSVVNIIGWFLISPLAWLLLRTLRLRYWQPWTTPEQWEPPAATPPTRTLLMTWANRKR